jgi:protein-S-isoprenylcysteine O-methyltransferase Ste14
VFARVRSFLFERGFILPVTVTGVVPAGIVFATTAWRHTDVVWLGGGALLYGFGLFMLALTTGLFAVHHGSLAPWNPPTELVVVGPYRYCRNPMITGIYAMLLGETIAFRSAFVGGWALAFILGMSSHILFQEERALRVRFGESYDEYCKNVPRWLPRLVPYEQSRR